MNNHGVNYSCLLLVFTAAIRAGGGERDYYLVPDIMKCIEGWIMLLMAEDVTDIKPASVLFVMCVCVFV